MSKDKYNDSFVGTAMAAVRGVLAAGGTAGLVGQDLAARYATESEALGVAENDLIEDARQGLRGALVGMESQLLTGNEELDARAKRGLSVAAEAAEVAAMAASGLQTHVRRDPFAAPANVPTGSTVIHNYMGQGSHPRVAFEAYDETEIRNSVVSSTVLNYCAARQDAFCELFWSTVVMAADQSAYHMHLSQINVMKEVRRQLSGAGARYFDRVNLVKAAIDHTILENGETDVIPVVKSGENEHLFVDASDVAPWDHSVNGVTFKTAPFKMGVEFDILGASQNDALIRAGVLDQSDALDPAIQLKALYIKVANDVIKLDNIGYLTSANFVPAPQGDSRAMILSFNAQTLPITKSTTKVDGSNLTGALADIKTNEWVLRLKVNVNGQTNLQDALTSLQASPLTFVSLTDKDGAGVDTTSGQGQAIVQAITGSEVLGYDLVARRTNSNKRTRGLLLDMSSFSILYTVPLYGPISTNRPLSAGEQHSQSDLAALITATRTFTSNRGVTALLEINKLLSTYAEQVRMGSDFDTEYLGISRKLVQPFHVSEELDIKKVVASLKSEDRPAQVQAVLVNKIRDMVFRAWYESGLGVAANAVFAGEAPAPIVKIGCDPVLARYLQVHGDLRTIGGKFDVRIEASWDARMQNQIFIAFGYDTVEGQSNYHVLNFGMLLWKPEVVIAAPIYRQGATHRELTVQPSFLNVCNTPILMHLTVKNLKEAAVDTVAINTRQI